MATSLLAVPFVLFIGYKILPTPTRFVIQTLILVPTLFIASLTCVFIGGFIKYLCYFFIPTPTRIYILQELYKSFGQVEWFMFEFWTNLRYVLSKDSTTTQSNLNELNNLNTILMGNHSESLFDFIPLGSISDYFNKTSKSFVFVKKAILLFPMMGWVEAVCPHAITLDRNWDKDKVLIADVCKKFNQNTDYKLVTPWMWFIFPEGTRFSKRKLKKAQEFALTRGYHSHSNLLQPRVKGFSYLTNNLYESLGAIIDATILYKPVPATPKNVFINTRFCKYIHIHLRIYKKENIPNDINELNQWLRDRWTEKDAILEKMKNNEIIWEIFDRSAWRAIKYYFVYAIWTAYIIGKLLFGISFGSVLSLQILICCIFPIVIVLLERSQELDL